MVDTNLYIEEELHPPEWMNNDFFEKVLKNVETADIKILDYAITPGTTKNEHYATIMFRTKIKYTVGGVEKMRSFIIKTDPTKDGQRKETVGEMSVFETEIEMYTETLPKLEAILRKYGDDTKLCARLVYYNLDSNKCIAFEDLAEKGYTSIFNRDCSMAEVKMALLKLAKIHAISYKLAQEGDTSITAHDKGSFNSVNVEEVDFLKNSAKLFKEIISAHADLREYLPHIEHVESDILKKCVATFNAYVKHGEREGIFVLNHGDFHMKNMMVRNVDGALKDLMLLDYQISIFASPAIDILYSVFMLMSPDMRLNHREELIYYYFRNFQEVLRKVEFTGHIPTMEEFHRELRKHKHWELCLMMGFLVINYVFRDGEGDIQKIVEDENYRRKIFHKPEVLAELRVLLPRLLHAGYFE